MYSKSSLILAMLYTCCALAKELTDIEILTSLPTRCTYEHAFNMYGAHCAGLRLQKIPNLKGSIEILDFSDNKLRKISSDTLSSYTSIKFLYLSDNKIFQIENDAFDSLTELQTLDLSNNVIIDLPANIFQLPNLRKLYLSGNSPIHEDLNQIAQTTTIGAPLELLDISNCEIKVLPEWGLLPQLIIYNVSHNPLRSLNVKYFPAMCNLAKIDITNSIENIRLCDLRPAISWFQDRLIYFQLDDYSTLNSREFAKCSNTYNADAYNSTFQRCKSKFLQVESKPPSRRTWLTVTGGLLGFLVGFVLLLYLMHRHNVARIKSAEKKKTKLKEGNAVNAMLINDVS
ncbi:leucine-rich repeat-containing protein let-4 [Hyposmocoma kahamanoa]|uniref:leucine-rich repeat-containing protein let-4 n=1 Tax=Hyposmocoma kahamanoa TaxID=1477025 RepID=UPI000E6D9571|nr:leucine-rich repeat-containing protein let-4 [Hyposmocoma kahamanoa]